MLYVSAVAMGAAVALIAVAIFAVVLRRLLEHSPSEAVNALFKLIVTLLGGNSGGYLIFQFLLKRGDVFPYYFGTCGGVFVIGGVIVWVSWWRLQRVP